MTIELGGNSYDWQLTIDALDRLEMAGWCDVEGLERVIQGAASSKDKMVTLVAAGIDLPDPEVRKMMGKWTLERLAAFTQDLVAQIRSVDGANPPLAESPAAENPSESPGNPPLQ